MNRLHLLNLLLVVPGALPAQQVADSAFRFPITQPTYATGAGPRVCIDSGHQNFHTMHGRYHAFANLLRQDGFRVLDHPSTFGGQSLRECEILVISNALAEPNVGRWAYPHESAFQREEVDAVLTWVREGGALLLIADHAPFAGAAADLGVLLGAAMFDGYVPNTAFGEPDPEALRQGAAVLGTEADALRERLGTGTLGDHVIIRGRNPDESVGWVVTFTGQAFRPAGDAIPLLIMGSGATGHARPSMNLEELPASERPTYDVTGWAQGAARTVAAGRVVVLGEAAMCSAQLAGAQRLPMGMNNALAARNPQFCLNAVRWLARALDD